MAARMSPSKSVATRSRWPFLSLIPIGLGAWAPIYAGVKAHVMSWVLWGVLWCAFVVAGFVADSASGHPGSDNLAGFFLIVGWVGAAATSFIIRGAYERQVGSPLLAAEEAGEQRLRERERAARLARQRPDLAREMGIGRPDVKGAADAGLVDVNNASVTALLGLPGVDGDVATLIIEAREKVHGFASLEDMGAALDLDGHLVEGLRGAVVFLPRSD
jgi:hypothetical protein